MEKSFYSSKWYSDVKAVLPENIRVEAEREFDNLAGKIDSKDFVFLVTRFVDEKIGKSASNPASLKVYSTMTGYSQDYVKNVFVDRNLL